MSSFQDVLAAQIAKVNAELNAAYLEARENEELQTLILSFKAQLGNLKDELEGGSLQGVLGLLAVLGLQFRQIVKILGDTESGKQLVISMTEIQGYYLNFAINGVVPAEEPDAVKEVTPERLDDSEELEREQARHLKEKKGATKKSIRKP